MSTATACDTVKKNCPSGQTCSAFSTASTSGRCYKEGICDTKSGLCDKHNWGLATAKVGDTCKSDHDCAGNQQCFIEFDEAKYLLSANKICKSNSECCSGTCSSGSCAPGPCVVRNRNGYCATLSCTFANSLTMAACDSGSICNSLYSGGVCQKKCTMASAATCRGKAADYFGDYECRGWNNLSIGGKAISSGPVCDFGPSMPCTMLQSSTLSCSSVGSGATNPTNMSCRNIKNKKLANKYHVNGFCYDDTASGKVAP